MRLCLLLLAACGTGELIMPPDVGMQLASEEVVLESGHEETRCWYVNLRNTEPIDVVRLETAQRLGQHHFNIFASNLDKPDGWGRCPTNEELFVGARPIIDGS